MAYEAALFLVGMLVGSIVGGAFVLREQRRECERRMRLVRRYLAKERV